MIDKQVIDNVEEIEMSRRRNVSGDPEVKRGVGRWLVGFVVLVGVGYLGVQALIGYLRPYAPVSAAPEDLTIGTWATAIVLAGFLVWCFRGSNGGR